MHSWVLQGNERGPSSLKAHSEGNSVLRTLWPFHPGQVLPHWVRSKDHCPQVPGMGFFCCLLFYPLTVLFTRLQTKQTLAAADGLGEFSFSSDSAPARQRNVLRSFSGAQRRVLFGSLVLARAARGWATVLCSPGTGEAQGHAGPSSSSSSSVVRLLTFLTELR